MLLILTTACRVVITLGVQLYVQRDMVDAYEAVSRSPLASPDVLVVPPCSMKGKVGSHYSVP